MPILLDAIERVSICNVTDKLTATQVKFLIV